MELTPQDVQQKKFERAKRGFDPREVGVFLDRVASAMAARDREIHESRTEIDALNRAVVDVKQNEEAFRLTMTAATEVKEEMLRRATDEAQRLEDEAHKGAEVIVERARVEAEGHIASIKREVESLRDEKERLEHQIADLRGTAATVQNSLDAIEVPDVGTGGRPSLELVVDKKGAKPSSNDKTPSELAARVGDLRG